MWQFFEVHRNYVWVGALSALAAEGAIDRDKVVSAIEKYGIDADGPAPRSR